MNASFGKLYYDCVDDSVNTNFENSVSYQLIFFYFSVCNTSKPSISMQVFHQYKYVAIWMYRCNHKYPYIRIFLHIHHPTFLHLFTAATISMYYIRLLMILSRTHITINDEIITAISEGMQLCFHF